MTPDDSDPRIARMARHLTKRSTSTDTAPDGTEGHSATWCNAGGLAKRHASELGPTKIIAMP